MNRALTQAELMDMLREENRQLRARLAALENADAVMRAARVFGLTKLQATLFVLLLRRGEATKSMLIDAGYAANLQAMIGDAEMALRSVVKHMRRAIRAHGLDVSTLYGLGYYMPETSRRRARALMAAHGEGK